MNISRIWRAFNKDADLPDDFDWRAYVDRYGDLRAAGIDSRRKAAAHYLSYGRSEKRWATAADHYAPGAYVCPSVHSLYLRATGALVCWDDAGNETVLQKFDPAVDYANDVYLGTVFNDVRKRLSDGRLPFEACRECLVLQSNRKHSSYFVSDRVVQTFQLEPSYKCSLDCPGCVSLADRKLAMPRNLPLPVVAKILADFVAAGIRIHAFDFQGHGEPLMHPELWTMTRIVRDAYPDTHIAVTTNAHGKVDDRLAASGIDEIICAIDGVDQASFEKYRINGRFRIAYKFMADAAALREKGGRRIRVIWKYILFEHNSTREHLAILQDLAEEAAVDELVIVFTRNGPRALRLDEPSDLSLRVSSVPVSFRFHRPEIGELQSRVRNVRLAKAAGRLDDARALAESVRLNVSRFFPPDDRPEAVTEMLAELNLELTER